MKYVILIYGNSASREVWNGMSAEQRQPGLDAYAALDEELAASGELVVSEALDQASAAKRVLVRQGKTFTTDGPFAEAKEVVAGFYLVECASMERAIEIAARIPESALGLVEVRPVISLSDFVS